MYTSLNDHWKLKVYQKQTYLVNKKQPDHLH